MPRKAATKTAENTTQAIADALDTPRLKSLWLASQSFKSGWLVN